MSTLRARGLVYSGARDFYDKHVPGGALAVAQALDSETAVFFEQIFLGTAMYDVMPVLTISETAARLSDVPHMELVKRNAAWQANHDLHGVYKLFVRALPPETVATRLPKLALKYFEFGEADAHMQGERCCIGEMWNIPAVLSPWMQACFLGFVPVALTVAGAKSVRLRTFEEGAGQSRTARPDVTVKIRLEMRWT